MTLEAMGRPSLALTHFRRAIAARGKLGYAPSALRIFRHMSDEATPLHSIQIIPFILNPLLPFLLPSVAMGRRARRT